MKQNYLIAGLFCLAVNSTIYSGQVDDLQFEQSLLSLYGSLLILPVDFRKLSDGEKLMMKSWADWVRKAPSGDLITKSSGRELAEKGYPVKFDNCCEGSVFEIIKK